MGHLSIRQARRPRGRVPLLLSLARLAVWWVEQRRDHGRDAARFASLAAGLCGDHFAVHRFAERDTFAALVSLGRTRPDSQDECVALLELCSRLNAKETRS